MKPCTLFRRGRETAWMSRRHRCETVARYVTTLRPMSRRRSLRPGCIPEQEADIACQDRLADRAERADLLDVVRHHVAAADFLRVVGRKHQTRGRQLHER